MVIAEVLTRRRGMFWAKMHWLLQSEKAVWQMRIYSWCCHDCSPTSRAACGLHLNAATSTPVQQTNDVRFCSGISFFCILQLCTGKWGLLVSVCWVISVLVYWNLHRSVLSIWLAVWRTVLRYQPATFLQDILSIRSLCFALVMSGSIIRNTDVTAVWTRNASNLCCAMSMCPAQTHNSGQRCSCEVMVYELNMKIWLHSTWHGSTYIPCSHSTWCIHKGNWQTA